MGWGGSKKHRAMKREEPKTKRMKAAKELRRKQKKENGIIIGMIDKQNGKEMQRHANVKKLTRLARGY